MSRFAKTLEQLGIPTAPCTAINVREYLTGWDRLYNSGMPLRYTTFPLPIAGASRQVHEMYVNGNDPVTGKPVMHQIVDALTRPLTSDEQSTEPTQAAMEPRLLLPDTEENLQELFKARDWTDYLPVVLPTEERVAGMLKGTSHKPDEVVKTIAWPGGGRRLTVEKVAVCAVMAGAKPEYFPVILATATVAPFGNSTTSMANMIIVNGAIRKEIGMNSGTGAMGPHNRANATIGRTFTLLSKSAGNLHAGVTTFGSLGSNLQYNNCCFAENEEAMPDGWEPLSVQFGYKKGDSVVTLATGWTYLSCAGELVTTYPPQMLIRDYMKSLSGMGSAALLCADPLVAGILHDQGFTTKGSLAQWLSRNVRMPVQQYWGNGIITTAYNNLGLQGLEPYAAWQKLPPDSLMEPFNNPTAINTVVVGGQTNTVWFITDFRVGKGVSIDGWR
ncbi:MAG: UGSC family (seleno)protein [Chloroflexota bacterium]